MGPIAPRAGAFSLFLALGSATVATLVPLVVVPIVVVVSVLGTGLLVVGVVLQRRPAIDLGGVGLCTGCLLVGFVGGPVLVVVLGVVGSIVAWDAAHYGVLMREQLGANADTTTAEAVHVGATAVVGSVVGLGTFVLFELLPPVGDHLTAGFFLLAAVLFVSLVHHAVPPRSLPPD